MSKLVLFSRTRARTLCWLQLRSPPLYNCRHRFRGFRWLHRIGDVGRRNRLGRRPIHPSIPRPPCPSLHSRLGQKLCDTRLFRLGERPMCGGTAACRVTFPAQDVRKAKDFGAVVATREQVCISTQVAEAFGRPLESGHEDTIRSDVDTPSARIGCRGDAPTRTPSPPPSR